MQTQIKAWCDHLKFKYHSMYPERRRYIAWLLLCAALAAHVADEASTGFLDLYNPTVAAMAFRRSSLRFQFGLRCWLWRSPVW